MKFDIVKILHELLLTTKPDVYEKYIVIIHTGSLSYYPSSAAVMPKTATWPSLVCIIKQTSDGNILYFCVSSTVLIPYLEADCAGGNFIWYLL